MATIISPTCRFITAVGGEQDNQIVVRLTGAVVDTHPYYLFPTAGCFPKSLQNSSYSCDWAVSPQRRGSYIGYLPGAFGKKIVRQRIRSYVRTRSTARTADNTVTPLCHVRFSNRPFGVKRFQTIHHWQCRCRSRARASLRNRHQGPSIMGFEDEVEQSLGRPCRQTTAGPSGHTNSPHPSSREGHHSTARWSSSVLLSRLILKALMPLRLPGSSGTRCRQPRCGA